MIRNILTLVAHDLAVAFKNKTILLILCIPLFVYGTLLLVDGADAPDRVLKLGLPRDGPVDAALRKHLESAPGVFALREAADLADGREQLSRREIDGLLVGARDDPSRVAVIVLRKDSPATLAILQRFAALQLAAEGSGTNWIADVRSLHPGTIELQSLPTWILMVVLLVGFFVLPTQVAEEKEKQLLLGLLQTPLREGEWLGAKLAYGMTLMAAAVLALHVLGRCPGVRWTYLATLGAGCVCFGAAGIALGLLCRSQASARTLGVICYLPLLLPSVLSDVSKDLGSVARLLPSSSLYGPVQALLHDQTNREAFPVEWLTLLGLGAAALLLAHRLIRVRWLM